ncbi:hypothetical protein [Alkalihalobacillus sp. LMS39]|uniref:hypothetical protein n=1 Tax=Alkalihalobacillus sp. LMS39 TaxID=2924032 RepID=UPI001FB2514F|nr:hypothetical protein [Alkalihalobacillus sp. LMS39]UOE96053.1 hypothetical protein MM271_10830 [Alkalihalobacillus sp. LMS39]
MKTTALANCSHIEMSLIIEAMTMHSYSLSGFEKKLFDLDLDKVRSRKKKVELDGCGLKQIAIALRRKGITIHRLYGNKRYVEERKKCFNLAIDIDLIRIKFQQENGPKVKAQTAATVHAS